METQTQTKRYSKKQSYWAGYFYGKISCIELTTNAKMIDAWNGYPIGFDWLEYRTGYIAGWNEGKLLHQSKKYDEILSFTNVLNSDFSKKMFNAVEDAEKIY